MLRRAWRPSDVLLAATLMVVAIAAGFLGATRTGDYMGIAAAAVAAVSLALLVHQVWVHQRSLVIGPNTIEFRSLLVETSVDRLAVAAILERRSAGKLTGVVNGYEFQDRSGRVLIRVPADCLQTADFEAVAHAVFQDRDDSPVL